MPNHLLTPEIVAFLESGHLLTLATQGERGMPTLSPALACCVMDDRTSLLVYVSAPTAGDALANVAANGQVSLLCAMPGGPHALQVKGHDAALCPVGDDAGRLIQDRREALAAELLMSGFGAEFGYALGDYPQDRLGALRFTPLQLERRQGQGALA
jgi:hypothetical protein